MTTITTDFLIIGSGLAGLFSGEYASKFGKVIILNKTTNDVSNSYWAQGGIAAAVSKDDSPDLHYEDTVRTGRGICNKKNVKILVNEGVDRVKDLINWGMNFDKENGKITLGLEGGHSKRRILHAGGDATGKEIVNFLTNLIFQNKNITLYENTLAYKLIVKDNVCLGAKVHNYGKNESHIILAKAIVLATGGYSSIYKRTTNPYTSTGDGIVLAYDAGAVITDMEFIQFHPTSFYTDTGYTFLISEAIRGEGAYLKNDKGERFVKKISDIGELAPRDVVASAIYNEMKNSGKNNVFLTLDHLDAEKIKKRFKNTYTEAGKFGIDITKDPIPVAPAAHYSIGGVKTDVNGETSIKKLFACGEVASTGVHGGNRLASNSLLECIVFGKRAVDKGKEYFFEGKYNKTEDDFIVNDSLKETFQDIKNKLSEIMTLNVGIVRSETSLKLALKEINKIDESIKLPKHYEYFADKLKSVIELSTLITTFALKRKESRGAHIREDYKTESNNYLVHFNKSLSSQISREKI